MNSTRIILYLYLATTAMAYASDYRYSTLDMASVKNQIPYACKKIILTAPQSAKIYTRSLTNISPDTDNKDKTAICYLLQHQNQKRPWLNISVRPQVHNIVLEAYCKYFKTNPVFTTDYYGIRCNIETEHYGASSIIALFPRSNRRINMLMFPSEFHDSDTSPQVHSIAQDDISWLGNYLNLVPFQYPTSLNIDMNSYPHTTIIKQPSKRLPPCKRSLLITPCHSKISRQPGSTSNDSDPDFGQLPLVLPSQFVSFPRQKPPKRISIKPRDQMPLLPQSDKSSASGTVENGGLDIDSEDESCLTQNSDTYLSS